MRSAAPLVAAFTVVLLSGCSASNGADGQSVVGEGSIAYNGASTGNDHTEFQCGDTAEVHLSSNLGSGQVKITLTDSAGAVVYTKTLGGPGQQSDTKTVHGAAGNGWVVTGERTATSSYGVSSFSGQYLAHVQC